MKIYKRRSVQEHCYTCEREQCLRTADYYQLFWQPQRQSPANHVHGPYTTGTGGCEFPSRVDTSEPPPCISARLMREYESAPDSMTCDVTIALDVSDYAHQTKLLKLDAR